MLRIARYSRSSYLTRALARSFYHLSWLWLLCITAVLLSLPKSPLQYCIVNASPLLVALQIAEYFNRFTCLTSTPALTLLDMAMSQRRGDALSVYELLFQKFSDEMPSFTINRRIQGNPIQTPRHRQRLSTTGTSILRCLWVYEKKETPLENVKFGNLPLVPTHTIDCRTTQSAT
jgi:hypothetical protein